MKKTKCYLTHFLLCLGFLTPTGMHAQQVGVKNNVLWDAFGSLSLGAEVAVKPRATVELYGGFRPWKRTATSTHKSWALQGQYRFWTCQKFNGFFWGPYVQAGEYNISNARMPFNLFKGLRTSRYEGWLLGAGLGCGYDFALAKHWNAGADIGFGYTYLNYKKFDCGTCGNLREKSTYNYWGPSKASITVTYLF